MWLPQKTGHLFQLILGLGTGQMMYKKVWQNLVGAGIRDSNMTISWILVSEKFMHFLNTNI
jgi:hypothetical protein